MENDSLTFDKVKSAGDKYLGLRPERSVFEFDPHRKPILLLGETQSDFRLHSLYNFGEPIISSPQSIIFGAPDLKTLMLETLDLIKGELIKNVPREAYAKLNYPLGKSNRGFKKWRSRHLAATKG